MSSFVHKLTLLNRLLDATRECQIQFSTKKEIMTETNSCVSCVCRQFEDVLSHGVKQRPIVSGIATIQNVTGLQLVDQDIVFWHCIQKHLSKHEVERFDNLENIKTDIGKGRAWLRSSLNEHTLERIFQMLLGDLDGLEAFYTKESFMLDQEKSSLLPQIAAGLKSIVFCIRIDDSALNSFPQSSAGGSGHRRVDSGGFSIPSLTAQVGNLLGHEVTMESFPEAAVQNPTVEPVKGTRDRKRKKKAKTKIITFGHNGGHVSDRCSSFSSVDDQESSRSLSRSKSGSATSVEKLNTNSNGKNDDHPEKMQSHPSEGSEISGPSEAHTVSGAVATSNPVWDTPADADQTDPAPVSATLLPQSNAVDAKFNPASVDDIEPDDDDIYKSAVDDGEQSGSESPVPNSDALAGLKLDDCNPFNGASALSHPISVNPSLTESNSESKIAERLESSFQLRFGSGSDLSSLNESGDVDVASVVSTSSSNQFEMNSNVNSDTASVNSGNLFGHLYENGSLVPMPTTVLRTVSSESPTSRALKTSSPVSSGEENTGKNGELQKALVVLLQRKDELMEENRALKELLEEEKLHSSTLRVENERLKQNVAEQERHIKEDAQKQTRENDVLRNQLKKYVGAVHALQHGKASGIAQGIVAGTSKEEESASADHEPDADVKLYEQKLTEVTEMHGELMEFTESLHTRFLSALSLIHKMHDELVSLRGPMPTDDVIRAIQADKPRDGMSSIPILTRALINVWVPSAFMQGSGPESHHVYQVYICVGEDEWNVYRRYSDFHAMHSTLCKSYPEIQSFGFPPKKGIGNRSSKFVEERRKSFQKYLRLVMHNVFQNNAQLKANPKKSTLLHILPFFSDAGDHCRVIVGKNKR